MNSINVDNITKMVIEEGNGIVHVFEADAAKRIILKHELSKYLSDKSFTWEKHDSPTVHINSKVTVEKK